MLILRHEIADQPCNIKITPPPREKSVLYRWAFGKLCLINAFLFFYASLSRYISISPSNMRDRRGLEQKVLLRFTFSLKDGEYIFL